MTEEGFRASAYTDTTGHVTIGFGFNVSSGITRAAAAALLGVQLTELHEQLRAYAWYATDTVRQSVLLDLAFNVGLAGLLHFVRMLAAVAQQNWPEAQMQLLDSRAARQDPNRYASLATMLLTGESPKG